MLCLCQCILGCPRLNTANLFEGIRTTPYLAELNLWLRHHCPNNLPVGTLLIFPWSLAKNPTPQMMPLRMAKQIKSVGESLPCQSTVADSPMSSIIGRRRSRDILADPVHAATDCGCLRVSTYAKQKGETPAIATASPKPITTRLRLNYLRAELAWNRQLRQTHRRISRLMNRFNHPTTRGSVNWTCALSEAADEKGQTGKATRNTRQ